MTAPDAGAAAEPTAPETGVQGLRPWLIPALALVVVAVGLVIAANRTRPTTALDDHPHGPIAADITAAMGDPVPYATADQREAFENGEDVALTRFSPEEGLGPSFNVTFCTACHERPVTGGSAGTYRNFFLAGTSLPDGSFVPAESVGDAGGVIRMYTLDPITPLRPPLSDDVNVMTQRNPIPFFGVGLLAEIPDAEILSREDPDDADGDGISGRANFDRGFVGRFGRKSQTVSIEGFLRGPLFNHLGITTDPLTEAEKALLPVDSSGGTTTAGISISIFLQAAAPDGPLTDFDGVPDPELSNDDLFDLVSYAMLLAAPEIEEPNEQERRGAEVFDALSCGACHTPRLEGPRGPLPVYSDLLLHDMGPDLADGLVMGDATGSEFRTQPLWGLTAVGPYLHDGRAATITDAILMHGGEAQASRDAAATLDDTQMADLVAFLESLGGRSQYTPGLIAPNTPIGDVGTLGGPTTELSAEEEAAFLAGRDLFDRDFAFSEGVGAPGFNGDSCRACHFEPVVGGSGPLGVNVMRHGYLDEGGFVFPEIGTILPKQTAGDWFVPEPDEWREQHAIFEFRQTPALFGLGLIDDLPDEVILANADPNDADGDGISGVVARTQLGQIGRFGWKAQVPSLVEFVRDAMGAELGLTMAEVPDLYFGLLADDDGVPDAEFDQASADLLLFYLRELAPPPRRGDLTGPAVVEGETVFGTIGCSDCHIPALEGPGGPVAAYSDFLLHEILPDGSLGIEDGTATMLEFRTAPLWGLALTGPYMHDGLSTTIDDAIRVHDGEAAASREAYTALTEAERAALIAFLESL
jgi:CxxC motif-containing protein (DUF1111 family)